MTDLERYQAAAHAMQSGVAMKMNYSALETTPKHLRVGVNCSMVETSAIVRLLVAKGIITAEEWTKELADEMERERDRYVEWLEKQMNRKVTLG
jgi:polyhydroxyalkanoate synthesis regulator phasin